MFRRFSVYGRQWRTVMRLSDLTKGKRRKDLMARMGHDDMRAALIYQRATSDADERIAEKLSELVEDHREGNKTRDVGDEKTGD